MYSDNELRKIQRILTAFHHYISRAESFNITYLYPITYIYTKHNEQIDSVPINDAEHLFRILLQEMTSEILLKQHAHTAKLAHTPKAVQTQIRKQLRPYLRQFPEYRHFLNDLLQR